MLRLLLALTIIVLPNTFRFSVDTGIPGVNLTNLLFLLLCIGLVMSGRDWMPMQRGQLTLALTGLISVIVMGFLNTQLNDPGDFSEDFARLKDFILYPGLYWVYRRSHQDLLGTRQLILLTLAVVAITGMEAIQQGLQFSFDKYSPTDRAVGPFGHLGAANVAGVFYAIFLPMFLAIVVFFRGKWFWRVAALAGVVILSLAIMVTYSRQGYLIALIGAFLLLLHRNVLMAILLGALVTISISLLPASVTQRVMETQQSTSMEATELDGSTVSRFHIWEGAIQMWRKHPGGVGLDRFKDHIGNYTNYPGKDAHSAFVLMLAECGALGIAALMWLFWRLWGLTRRLLHSTITTDPETLALALGFTFAVISVALGNLFSSFFFVGSAMGNFWILCGLLERYVDIKKHAAGEIAAGASAVPMTTRGVERFPLLARISPNYQRRN